MLLLLSARAAPKRFYFVCPPRREWLGSARDDTRDGDRLAPAAPYRHGDTLLATNLGTAGRRPGPYSRRRLLECRFAAQGTESRAGLKRAAKCREADVLLRYSISVYFTRLMVVMPPGLRVYRVGERMTRRIAPRRGCRNEAATRPRRARYRREHLSRAQFRASPP